MDKSEKIVFLPQYESVNVLENGYIIVCSNGKYGLLDALIEEVFQPKYDEIHFREEYFCFQINGKWGCLDEYGKEIIPPLYDCFIDFENDLAIGSIGDKMVLINKNNEKIVPVYYDWINPIMMSSFFVFKKNKKAGIINLQGEVVLPAIYDSINNFVFDDYIGVEKDNRYGVFELREESVCEFIPCIHKNISFGEDNHLFSMEDSDEDISESTIILYENGFRIINDIKEGKYLENKEGDIILPPMLYDDFDILKPYKYPAKYLKVKLNSRYALFDLEGNSITDFVYDEIEYGRNANLLIVKQGALYGFLDLDGHIITPVVYSTLAPVQNLDVSFFRQGDTWGFLDMKGKVINAYPISEFNNRLYIEDKCLVLETNNKWSIYNFDQHQLIETDSDNIDEFKNGLAIFRQVDKYGFMNTLGNIVIKAIYDKVYQFSNDLACVMVDNKYGFVNMVGDLVIPIIYDSDIRDLSSDNIPF